MIFYTELMTHFILNKDGFLLLNTDNSLSQMATFMSHTPPHKPSGPWSAPVRIPTSDCQDPPFNGNYSALTMRFEIGQSK